MQAFFKRILPILFLVLTGCTHTYQLSDQPEIYRSEIEEFSTHKTARIQFLDSSSIKARHLTFNSNTLRFTDPNLRDTTFAALDSVTSISFTYRGGAAFGGLVRGLVIGAGSGAVIGYATGKNSYWGREGAAYYTAASFGALGGAGGLFLGIVKGDQLIYSTPADTIPGNRRFDPIQRRN